jgi:hypothetical protein
VPRSRGVLAAAGVVWAGLAGFLAFRFSERAVDDFFITYRYAWNLLHGHGFVFNSGERVFGLTDPGFGLLLAAAGYLTRVSIPTLGTFLTGAAMVGIALFVLREAQERGREVEALVAGTLTVLSSCLWVNQGAGVFWALLLLLAAAHLGGRWPLVAGALAGLALWMRPDAAAAAACLALLLWLETRRLPWRFALGTALVALAGVAAAWAWFGTALPNTFAAKRGVVDLASTVPGIDAMGRFWERAARVLPRHWGRGWRWLALAGLLGHAVLWLDLRRVGRTLAFYSLFLAVAYPLLGVPFSFWYLVPTVAGVLYGATFLCGAVSRRLASLAARRGLKARWGRACGLTGVGIGALLLAAMLSANLAWLRGHDWQAHLVTYRAAAVWLREHSPETDDVAYVEIGVWGYYSRRTVVDLLGLVTPSSIPFVQKGDRLGAFLARPTRWVVFHSRGGMAPLTGRAWFPKAYEEVVRFEEGGERELVLYRRRPGVAIPPPRPPRVPRPR